MLDCLSPLCAPFISLHGSVQVVVISNPDGSEVSRRVPQDIVVAKNRSNRFAAFELSDC